MKRSTIPPPTERFHANVVGLGELICEIVHKMNDRGYNIVDGQLVELGVCLIAKLDHTTVINTFIHKSSFDSKNDPLPFESHCWTKIKAKDRSFFINNSDVIFSGLPKDKVDAFSRMFALTDENGKQVIPESDEEELWEYFQSLVKIAIKYIHTRRETDPDFLNKIDLERHVRHWKVKLE